MKNYPVTSLLDDSYINPTPAVYDNGTHPRSLGQIRSISVHHDASPRPHAYDSVARYRQEAAQHYARLGPGLQYHFKIDNTGEIFATRPLDEWLYCVGSAENMTTIAICLDGYFHPPYNERPTREQYEALAQLLTYLCDERGDLPISWPDVRPHRDFSSTACPGDTLAPYVYAINSKADAYNIPDVPYDWPEMQPAPEPTPQPPAPIPTIIYENINSATYVAQVATHLDDAATMDRVKDFPATTEFIMVRRMRVGDATWLQTQYSVDKTPTRGVPEKDLVLKNPGTAPAPDPTPVPTPPVPEIPPTPVETDHDRRLTALEALVGRIIAFLSSIFVNFKS